jgi:hypothetical protein
MKVEGGTLQMAPTMSSINNSMKLIQNMEIISTCGNNFGCGGNSSRCSITNRTLLVDTKKIMTHHGETRLEGP